jgi:nicotinamide-nucleotide amidase
MLRDRKLTLAIAESCTGGFLSHLVTSVPGSSDYLLGSIVSYSNSVKVNNLGVSRGTLEQHGAVSEQTVKEMANLVRLKFNAHIGVATSGVAGPGGGTSEKPVGTVWIAFANAQTTVTRKLQLSNDRQVNIRLASIAALNLIRTNL